jgi:hypothetical protein
MRTVSSNSGWRTAGPVVKLALAAVAAAVLCAALLAPYVAGVATYWLAAFGPTLRTQRWRWPTATSILRARPVPDVTGMLESPAAKLLAGAGFVLEPAPIECGSEQRSGTVAYYEPQVAAPGASVTVCLSNGRLPARSAPPATTGTPAT